MFENLTNRLAGVFSGYRGKKLTEENITSAIREVRTALLEADVALEVVIRFVEAVKNKSVGRQFVASVRPGDMFIKFVHDELVAVMGTDASGLDLDTSKKPAVILMAGLQGTGKTTTVAKLAKYLSSEEGLKVSTVSADVYRPAAIEQLRVLSANVDVHFVEASESETPVQIVNRATELASEQSSDVLIVDTAGRLAVDEEMMAEIKELHEQLNPAETLFVVDAMTGQDAANTARAFNRTIELSGVVLTKSDGDARGGAALSVRAVTNKPIKFLGTGENIDGLERFHPERIASRILGMGDVLGLVEEAQKKVDIEQSEKVVKRIFSGATFNFEDMRAQLDQVSQMGGMAKLLDRMPNAPGMKIKAGDDEEMSKFLTIIDSMTAKERVFPNLLNVPSRKQRIAKGSGTRIQDVNLILRKLKQMQKATKRMSRGKSRKAMAQLDQMMQDR